MMRTTWLVALMLCMTGALLPAVAAPKVLGAFTLEERFGVAHPEQIVYFTLPKEAKAGTFSIKDGQGKPVPFQVMTDGRVALRTDLPAGATRSWTVTTEKPPVLKTDLVVKQWQGYYEITNTLAGIRVPMRTADLAQTLSPIQGLRYRDGTWTATGPNLMGRPALGMKVEFLESGPLVVRVKITYYYDRAALHGAREPEDIPAGEGDYSSIIELQAGQPSILFEEESDVDIQYAVDIYQGLAPDRAQYRGHHAGDLAGGRDPDGKVYSYNNNTRHDALVDLNYNPAARDRWSGAAYPYMSHWDPWGVSTGFYWQLYNSAPDGSDNLFGIFAGRASRLYTPGLSGVAIDTGTRDGKRYAGIRLKFQRLMPTQFYARRMRFGWGIYLGKKSLDVKPQMEVQEINRQMNLHSGVNLNTLSPLPADFPDPPQGYGSLYTKPEVIKRLADQLHDAAQRGDRSLYNKYYNINPYAKELLEFWGNPTLEQAQAAAKTITDFAHAYMEIQVNGEGIYQHSTHYFMGASTMSTQLLWIDQLLASGLLPAEKKRELKQIAALYAIMLWDDDVSPMQEKSGMNLGPANMSSMWRGTRFLFTIFLARHPLFAPRVAAIEDEVVGLLHDYVNADGACTASAHYTGASMVPILNLLLQLQMSGVADLCAKEPVLKRYAEWEMQLMTPREVRFGGVRKIIAVGDGSTEQSTRPGILGTAFAASDPALSARLMGAWQAMGSPHDNFYGATFLKIDPALPAVSPRLESACFQGWMSVLRNGWETPDETAVFFVAGDTLTDHRHNDQGTLVIYALGAPISLDWGCLYAPRASGGLLHSIAEPEAELGRSWVTDNTPLDFPSAGYSSWWNTVYRPFLSFGASASTGARFSFFGTKKDIQWQRTVRSIHPDPAHPVIVIDDQFTGKDVAGKPVISTLNLMAAGEVATPAGPVKPEERFYHCQDTAKQQLPSAGTPVDLQPGLNRFTFTGQWLIDWDLYTDAAGPLQAAIGNWAHNWHPATEQQQFRQAQGRGFEERQHILRLRGADHIRTLILPYRKDQRPADRQVTRVDGALRITTGEEVLLLGDDYYLYTGGGRKTLATFNEKPASGAGMTIDGGPAEIDIIPAGKLPSAILTLHGDKGTRKFTLPGDWTPIAAEKLPIRKENGQWVVDYAGGEPLTIELH